MENKPVIKSSVKQYDNWRDIKLATNGRLHSAVVSLNEMDEWAFQGRLYWLHWLPDVCGGSCPRILELVWSTYHWRCYSDAPICRFETVRNRLFVCWHTTCRRISDVHAEFIAPCIYRHHDHADIRNSRACRLIDWWAYQSNTTFAFLRNAWSVSLHKL